MSASPLQLGRARNDGENSKGPHNCGLTRFSRDPVSPPHCCRGSRPRSPNGLRYRISCDLEYIVLWHSLRWKKGSVRGISLLSLRCKAVSPSLRFRCASFLHTSALLDTVIGLSLTPRKKQTHTHTYTVVTPLNLSTRKNRSSEG